MARLARLRFSGLGHEYARMDDLMLDFTDGARRAVDSTIWLRNGGGKSSLLNLFFSLVRPGRRAFLGGKVEQGERELQDYVQPDDHGVVAAEWELDVGNELPLGIPPERVVTGVFYEWRRSEGADEAQLKSLFYAARSISGAPELTLDGLPLFADPSPGASRGARRTLAGFRIRWQELRDRYPDAGVMWTDQAREWTQRLDELGLDAELFKYQIRMNAHEGGADQLFTPFKRTEDYIDFFLELALDPAYGEELVHNIDTYRTELRERVERLVPERDLTQGLLERLGPLRQVRDRRAILAQRAARLQAGLRTLTDYAARRLGEVRAARDAAVADAEAESAAAATAHEETRRARAEAAWLRRWLAGRALERAQEQERLSREQYATTEQNKFKWEAAIPLRDARRHQREADQAMEQLMRRRDDYSGLRAELATAARGFLAALLARAADCRARELRAQEEASAEETRRNAALERATDARVRIASADTRAQAAAAQLAQGESEISRLGRQDVLREGEDPPAALTRLSTAVTEATASEQRTAEYLSSARGQIDGLQSAEIAAETDRTLAEATEQAITRELEAACTVAAALANRETLRRGLELDAVNVRELGPEAVQRLRDAAHGLTERIVALRLEHAEDERAIVHLETRSLLPPNRSAEAAMGVLRGKLPAAWTGWEYIAEANSDPRSFVRRAPAIATGIVVRDADFASATALLGAAALDLDAPVLVVPQSALTDGGNAPGIVFGPTSDAWFSRTAGRVELDLRRTRDAARSGTLHGFEGHRQDLEATAASLRAFQDQYPTTWFAEREQARAESDASAASARERLVAIAADRARLRQEIEAAERRQREMQSHRQRAERARDVVQGFIDRYPNGLDPFRSLIADAQEQAVVAQRERSDAEAAAAASTMRISKLQDERKRAFADAEHYEREAETVRAVAGVEVAAAAGDVDGLRERFQRVQDEYGRKVGEDALAAIIEEKERSAKEASQRFRRKLKESLSEADVAAALDTLADPGLVELHLEEATAELSTAMGVLGNLSLQRARAEGALERATEHYEVATKGTQLDPPKQPTTDEAGTAAAGAAEARVQECQAAAVRHEQAASNAQKVAQRASDALTSLDKQQAVLTTVNEQAVALLDRLVRERHADVPEPEEDSEVGERLAALRREVSELGVTDAGLDGDRDQAARTLIGWFDEPRFEVLKSPMAARLRPWTPEQLESEVETLGEDLALRVRTIDEQLAEAERHRSMLVTELLHGAEEGLRLLRSLANQSKVPDHVSGLGGANFLRITTHEPEDISESRARLAALLDEVVTEGTIPKGLQLVQLAVHRVARPIGAKVLFPDPDAPATHKPIVELGKFSGGEKLTSATLLYCTLARLRARRRGRTVQPSGVLVLDNPIGKASRPKFIELQREVANQMGIQLVYTTGVNDYEALRMLPNIVRLENTRRDRRTGERLLEHADAASLQAARVGWSPEQRQN